MKGYLEKLSSDRCTDLEFCNTLNLSQVFTDSDAIDAKNLFIARFRRVPNWIHLKVQSKGKKPSQKTRNEIACFGC
jgi:hypothetical protein